MHLRRTVDQRWAEIDREVGEGGWSQGDLIAIPFAFAAYLPGLPSTPETLKLVRSALAEARGQSVDFGEVEMTQEDARWGVIATQDCLLIKSRQSHPWFQVALVEQMEDPDESGLDGGERTRRSRQWARAVSGANRTRFAISTRTQRGWWHPVLGKGCWYVDLRRTLPFEKGLLLAAAERGETPQPGVPEELRPRFALQLMENDGREAIMDSVDRRFLDPLIRRLRRLRVDGTATEHEILNEWVYEVRYSVESVDERTWGVRLYVCFTAKCSNSPERRLCAERFLGGLVTDFAAVTDGLVQPSVVYTDTRWEGISAFDYRSTAPLPWAVDE